MGWQIFYQIVAFSTGHDYTIRRFRFYREKGLGSNVKRSIIYSQLLNMSPG